MPELEVNPKYPLDYRVFILDDLPKNSICAEIGVAEGTFSKKILDICEPKLLHLIDPCLSDKFFINKKFFKGNYVIHKVRFEESKFKNNYFDWVYLDTTHTFTHTINQLKLCYKKVKKDGFITGDDYNEYFVCLKVAVQMFLRSYYDRVKLEYIKNGQFKIKKIK